MKMANNTQYLDFETESEDEDYVPSSSESDCETDDDCSTDPEEEIVERGEVDDKPISSRTRSKCLCPASDHWVHLFDYLETQGIITDPATVHFTVTGRVVELVTTDVERMHYWSRVANHAIKTNQWEVVFRGTVGAPIHFVKQ